MTASTTLPDYRVPRATEAAFLGVVIFGGQFLVPLLLLVCCVRGLNRHPTLLNFLASWILYSIATCLLLYTGNAFEAHPPEVVCLVQVPLQQAAFLVIAFSAVALMLQLWFTLPTVAKVSAPSAVRDILLIALPYVCGAIYLAIFFSYYAVSTDGVVVERGRLTCRLAEGQQAVFFSKLTPIVVALLLVICLVMSAWMLKKTVKKLANVRHWSLKDGLQAPKSPWLPILTRFSMFSFYATLTIFACLIVAATPQGIGRYIVDWYTATLPIAAFIIFTPWPNCSRPREHTEISETETATVGRLPIMNPKATLIGEAWVYQVDVPPPVPEKPQGYEWRCPKV
ncbi:hypothetical protein AURDEDRAFT_155664 [Auricularia subglabra TFB-10046 SS5]|nr:hypothetical protein AURDEDRAFT_155664 [Auricularia subglabra TFB-10046 SS5]